MAQTIPLNITQKITVPLSVDASGLIKLAPLRSTTATIQFNIVAGLKGEPGTAAIPNIPTQTVLGRLSVGTGTAENIPILTLLAGTQPLDADLTAIATQGTLPYGRSFLSLADGSAGRTLLGLGTAAIANSADFASSLTFTTHTAATGLGLHIPSGGITNSHVATGAGIDWVKVSKVGAIASDVGADTAAAKNLTPTATDPGNTATNSGFLSWLISAVRTAQATLSGLGSLATKSTITSADITDGTIVNTDISGTAAIGWAKVSKTGAVASDVGADPTGTASTAVSAHAGQTGLGLHIPSVGIADAHVSSGAAIAQSKIANLPADLAARISNLSIGTVTGTTVAIANSNGTGVTIPAATASAAGLMVASDQVKLAGIAPGATANSTDAQLRDRSTHTGTQAHTTITGLGTAAIANTTDFATAAQGTASAAHLAITAGNPHGTTAAQVGADPTGTASAAVAVHAALAGNSNHIPSAGIANANVATGAAIAWAKIDKTGAVAGDVGAVSTAAFASGQAAQDSAIALNTTHRTTTGNPHSTAIADISGLQTALDARQPLDANLTAIAALTTAPFGLSLLTTTAITDIDFTDAIMIDKALTVVIDDVGGGVIYRCEANPGTATSAAAWRIRRITIVGADITTEWANGGAFTAVCDNRLSLSYS